MRAYDFTPLHRATVGFDRVADLMDRVLSAEVTNSTYPPYNIERTGDDEYRITMAIAGFSEADLEIEAKENTLLVKGNQATEEKSEGEMLFQGIAARNFERRFQLADHVEVRAANLENGLLHITLVREIPEAMKPRKISISSANSKQIDAKPAKKS